jgi:hypothetical protein
LSIDPAFRTFTGESVVRPARLAGGLPAVLWLAAALSAPAQQISPPTPIAPDATGVGSTFAAPGSSYAPGATQAPVSPYAPGAYVPNGPTAALEGTIAPPPANWDPYATPGAQVPSLYSEAPAYGAIPPTGTPATGQRLLQHWMVDYHWFVGSNSANELGINDIELNAALALPFFYNSQSPLLVTPGFAAHYWNGPTSVPPGAGFDMPPQTFDTYLDLGWNPHVTQWLGGELNFRVGVYSDFDKVCTDSIRLQGKGLAVLTLSQQFQVKFGVWYINRNRVKILPAGGIVWTPNNDVRFEILFPNPKLAQRLTTWGTTEFWWYVSGEYGGGAWTITRDLPGNPVDEVDYNDIRVALGLEFKAMTGFEGFFEAGLAFDREIFYVSRTPDSFFRPNNTFFLRAGLMY